MLTDIEIAQSTQMKPIQEIAETAGVPEEYLECYGRYKAKVDYKLLNEVQAEDGKLILVTAITPTPAGEGKTTTSVGLADGLRKIGKNAVVALREPSLGPVFGVKGGAAGGGYAQVVPMEDINLHFTGDFNAIGIANTLSDALFLLWAGRPGFSSGTLLWQLLFHGTVGLLLLPGIIFLLDALSGALDLGRFLDDNRPPLERRRWGSRPRTVKEHTVNPSRGRK